MFILNIRLEIKDFSTSRDKNVSVRNGFKTQLYCILVQNYQITIDYCKAAPSVPFGTLYVRDPSIDLPRAKIWQLTLLFADLNPQNI